MILQDKHIVLGVTGGIACYKAVDLCSKLVQAKAVVDVVMTEAAARFVTPLSFQTLTKRPVSIDMFHLLRDTDMAHISLAARAQALLIAPATANTLAKLAHGLADNLLTSTALACPAPLILAPAMDADMWAHPATQANITTLLERGAVIVGPEDGWLASGRVGRGRLAPVKNILGALRQTLGRDGALRGVHVTVTAGGTQEPLDPVRHLGNRSSGRMGYALAEAARDLGAEVTLVSAPTCLATPYGIQRIDVRTAAEMHEAVMAILSKTQLLLMAAAVADYRPASYAQQKIRKTGDDLVLPMERTTDILAEVASQPKAHRPDIVVGFAAETEDLLENAASKLGAKKLDMIVANDVSQADSGFAVATNRATLLWADGRREQLPLMTKEAMAEEILAQVAQVWEQRHG
ncbi:MAG: bifunctional phosphopantothenoylcysteine decarboxylase/phosphopantothenate--cysteine ligase CoaBC [Anaerolineae bacterium]|nr:bifunctional phosphopantothenoylcysteine decarboxylase/phosphopantothenate--cysteine ligase CoaBC [Anaerolineae bacterium]